MEADDNYIDRPLPHKKSNYRDPLPQLKSDFAHCKSSAAVVEKSAEEVDIPAPIPRFVLFASRCIFGKSPPFAIENAAPEARY